MDPSVPLTQLLIRSPGNLAYHLILLFAIGGTLQAALVQWRRFAYPQARRLLIGLSALFLVRLLLFAAAGLAWQELLSFHTILPIADRATAAFSLVILGWIWAYPERSPKGDLLLGGGLALVLILSVATGVLWSHHAAAQPFNASPEDLLWSLLSLSITGGWLILVLKRKPNGYEAGVFFLGIMLGGWLFHVLVPPTKGDFDGALRIADLLAYPLLFTLPYRFAVTSIQAKPTITRQALSTPDSDSLQAFAKAIDTPRTARCSHLAEAFARFMRADICLIVEPPANGRITVACGYDLIRNAGIEGVTLPARGVPLLVEALIKRRALRLPASSTSNDLKALAFALGIPQTGPLLALPLPPDEEVPLQGGIIVLSPYAQHAWTAQEQERLAQIALHVGRWLSSEQMASSDKETGEQIADLLASLNAVSAENRRLKEQVEKCAETQNRLKALAAAYDETQRVMEQLEAEAQALERDLATESEARLKAEQSLKRATAEVARLKEEIKSLHAAKEKLTSASSKCISEELIEHLITALQNLRQPLAAIVGYTSLLSEETADAPLPQKQDFLDKIISNASRLEWWVDDALNVLALELGNLTPRRSPTDPAEVLTQALERNLPLIKERRQVVSIHQPQDLPTLPCDANLLRQIMQALIGNAALATPPEGTIWVSLEVLLKGDTRYLRFTVRDQGVGIPANAVEKAFKRTSAIGDRLIPGLGDYGVALPLTKALTEVLGGRIWVTSEGNKGSTFTVLLPVREADEAHGEG